MLLAQAGNPLAAAANVPRLPDPPLIPHYFLENPWPVAITLVIIAAIGLMFLLQRNKARQGMQVMLAGIALGSAVLLLAYLVTTEREVLDRRTRELAELAAKVRLPELRDYLTEESRIGSYWQVTGIHGRADALEAVRHTLGDQFPVETCEVGEVQAVLDGANIARTQAHVLVKPKKEEQQVYGTGIGAWVRIEWRREDQGPWRASAITILEVDGLGLNPEMGRD